MLRYEVSPMEAVAYINHFSQMIIKYLEENDHDKTLEIFLGEWRKEDEERFTKYDKQLKLILEKLDSLKDEDKPLSISDIDAQISESISYLQEFRAAWRYNSFGAYSS